jgi:hypothetical protein
MSLDADRPQRIRENFAKIYQSIEEDDDFLYVVRPGAKIAARDL